MQARRFNRNKARVCFPRRIFFCYWNPHCFDSREFHRKGGFIQKEGKEKWYSGPIPADYVLNEGDLIVAMTEQAEGLLGSSALIPKNGLYLHNQRLGLIRIKDPANADKAFLYHLFNLQTVRQQIRGSSSGTKIRHTSPSRIAEVKVRVPPLPIQRRIAGILSAYDDLTENNQRRIRILEEMARSLYHEWFVHFRFPGHEGMRMVDSPMGKIPEGWEVKKLGEILELKYGKGLKQEERNEGPFPVFGSSGIVGYHDESLVKGPGIIVGRKGNVGSVFWSDVDFYPIDTAYFVTSSLPLRFMFYDLQTKNFINNDAAVPGLSRHQAYSLETMVPSADAIAKFCSLADVFERQASSLRHQVENLRRTRDLLLPKLLSGQIPVAAEEESKVVAFPHKAEKEKAPNKEFIEALIIAALVRKLVDRPNFPLGAFRRQKFAYFAHRKAEHDVTAQYLKKAAGPYSPWTKYGGPEKIAQTNGYVVWEKSGSKEGFVPGPKIGEIDRYLPHQSIAPAIDWVVEKFHYVKNTQLELLSTVDFASEELRRVNRPVTVAEIRKLIAEDKEWAPKLDRELFSAAKVVEALRELESLFST